MIKSGPNLYISKMLAYTQENSAVGSPHRDIRSVDVHRKFSHKDPPPNRNSFAVLPPTLYNLLLGPS
jgi:hypothetical protein